jgi:hypothetical protein
MKWRVGAGFKPALAQQAQTARWASAAASRTIVRRGRMTRKLSRERRMPHKGGFETRPYLNLDLRAI